MQSINVVCSRKLTNLYIQLFLLILLFTGCANPYSVDADKTTITVLNYHGINDNSDNIFAESEIYFEEQIRYLSIKGYNAISLEDYNDWLKEGKRLPPKPILLTFDDGLKDHYEKAFPILKKYGFVGTLFVIVDRIDTPGGLSTTQLKEMIQSGFSIGSHTLNHNRESLIWLAKEVMNREVHESKEKLEKILGIEINFIAYPYGYFDESVKNSVKGSGYTGAFTTIPGKNHKEVSPFEQRRIVMLRETNLEYFKKLLEGDKELFTQRYQSDVSFYIKKRVFRPAEILIQELLNIDKEDAITKQLLKRLEIARRMSMEGE